MTAGPLRTVLRHLYRATAGASTDAALLERFRAHRDPAAFEAIVRRHGPMVWAACRRGLPCDADADDAFQATFLVLARRPENVRKPEALASWLYGVAGRVVKKSRALAARRLAVERDVPLPPPPTGPDAAEAAELRAVLDEELGQLPEKYRLPLLLCYFEGLTKGQAAERLGWPAGTVSGRLARARELLKHRLVRRGMAGAAAAVLTAANGEVRAEPVAALLAAARLALGGSEPAVGSDPHSVEVLAREVLQMLWLNRLKWAAATALTALAFGGALAGWSMRQTAVQPPATDAKAPPAAAGEGDGELTKLLRERRDAARAEWDALVRQAMAGHGAVDARLGCARRLLKAELDLATRPADRVAACQQFLDYAKEYEQFYKTQYDAGRTLVADYQAARYLRLDAEIKLLRERRAAAVKP